MSTRSAGESSDLRVVLPMLTLVPGGMGGSETYARELTHELARQPGVRVDSLVASIAAGFTGTPGERVSRRVHGGPSTKDRVRTQVTARFDREVRRGLREADVVHYPLSVPAPPPGSRPFATTVLDVQHHDLPELFSRAEVAYRALVYDRPARRADAVITISDFSKRRIVEQLGVDASRVHVAHLGVDASSTTPYRGPRDDTVLFPARGWPHKNHARLIEAMHLVRAERPETRLVLTGGDLDRLGDLPRWVERRGLVSRGDLLDLYRSSGCLAFPSLYEGFGLPPLEAMAAGCPVAAADAGSLPEVCGDAAELFDPKDPRAIADGIIAALGRSAELSRRGLEQCARFTWSACAEAHLEVYRSLAARDSARRP